jgi:hypothetical protein
MIRDLLILIGLLLLVSAAQAGDYVNTVTGELALARLDRKYTSEVAVAAGWVPIDVTKVPPEALAEAARYKRINLGAERVDAASGAVERRSWLIDAALGEIRPATARAQTDLQEHRALLATRTASVKLQALIQVELALDKLAAIEATDPDWVTSETLAHARAELEKRRQALR